MPPTLVVMSMVAGPVGAQLAALRRIRDPARRVVQARELLAQLRAAQDTVSLLRDAAIAAMADAGHSYQQIAAAAGVSRGRVAQVIRRDRQSPAH